MQSIHNCLQRVFCLNHHRDGFRWMSGHCGLGCLYLIVDRLQKEGKNTLEQFSGGVEELVVVDRVLVPQRQHWSLL